jgi:hypothetical protein
LLRRRASETLDGPALMIGVPASLPNPWGRSERGRNFDEPRSAVDIIRKNICFKCFGIKTTFRSVTLPRCANPRMARWPTDAHRPTCWVRAEPNPPELRLKKTVFGTSLSVGAGMGSDLLSDHLNFFPKLRVPCVSVVNPSPPCSPSPFKDLRGVRKFKTCRGQFSHDLVHHVRNPAAVRCAPDQA